MVAVTPAVPGTVPFSVDENAVGGGYTIPDTGKTTSVARTTRAMNADPKDTDFFIREFLGSNHY